MRRLVCVLLPFRHHQPNAAPFNLADPQRIWTVVIDVTFVGASSSFDGLSNLNKLDINENIRNPFDINENIRNTINTFASYDKASFPCTDEDTEFGGQEEATIAFWNALLHSPRTSIRTNPRHDRRCPRKGLQRRFSITHEKAQKTR